jgi:hypothetical protein
MSSRIDAAQTNTGAGLTLDVALAEYNSLRAEIGRLQDHQQQILSFGFFVLAAVATAFGSAVAGPTHPSLAQALRDFHLLLLVTPFIYLFLGILFAERTVKILRAGDYLDHDVRDRVKDWVGKDILCWEDYRRSPRVYSKTLARLLDFGRWFGFIAPMLLCLVLIAQTGPSLTLGDWVLLLLDAGAVILGIGLAFSIDEASGVRGKT